MRSKTELTEVGKKVKSMVCNSDCLLDMTKAWLLMISFLVDSNSLSVANEMCKGCLAMDASNIKTLETYADL